MCLFLVPMSEAVRIILFIGLDCLKICVNRSAILTVWLVSTECYALTLIFPGLGSPYILTVIMFIRGIMFVHTAGESTRVSPYSRHCGLKW
jgi:hypothetical protein